MEKSERVAARFLREFQLLLEKYSAEISAEDFWQGYAECGQDIRMTVFIQATYDDDGDILKDSAEIDLGKFFDFTTEHSPEKKHD